MSSNLPSITASQQLVGSISLFCRGEKLRLRVGASLLPHHVGLIRAGLGQQLFLLSLGLFLLSLLFLLIGYAFSFSEFL